MVLRTRITEAHIRTCCRTILRQHLDFAFHREIIAAPVHAVLVKVAAAGLSPEQHLGRPLSGLEPHLLRLRARYGCSPCGEGGEYESLVLDCPLFRARIVLDQTEVRFGLWQFGKHTASW